MQKNSDNNNKNKKKRNPRMSKRTKYCKVMMIFSSRGFIPKFHHSVRLDRRSPLARCWLQKYARKREKRVFARARLLLLLCLCSVRLVLVEAGGRRRPRQAEILAVSVPRQIPRIPAQPAGFSLFKTLAAEMLLPLCSVSTLHPVLNFSD